MTITASYEPDPTRVFRFTASGDIFVYLSGVGEIDWGDGTVEGFNSYSLTEYTHTMAEQAQVTISGEIIEMRFSDGTRSSTVENPGLITVDSAIPSTVDMGIVGMFGRCTNLKSVPENLFANITVTVTSAYWTFFGCTSLESVPENLFAPLMDITNFRECFRGCSSLAAIPEGLFTDNSSVTTFSQTFYGCSSVVEIPVNLFENNYSAQIFSETFRGTGITEVKNMFTHQTSAWNFSYCFADCVNLVRFYPLFGATQSETPVNFSGLMYGCTSLTTVTDYAFTAATTAKYYSDAFSGCTSLTRINFLIGPGAEDVSGLFRNCTGLTSIPTDVFYDCATGLKKVSNVFNGCSRATILPQLWDDTEYPAITTHTAAYTGCTSYTYYDSVPTGWK